MKRFKKLLLMGAIVPAAAIPLIQIASDSPSRANMHYNKTMMMDRAQTIGEKSTFVLPEFTNILPDQKVVSTDYPHLLSNQFYLSPKTLVHNATGWLVSKLPFIRPNLQHAFKTKVPEGSVIAYDMDTFFNEHSNLLHNPDAFEKTSYVKIKDDLYINAFDLVMLKEWTQKVPNAMRIAYKNGKDVFNNQTLDYGSSYEYQADLLDVYAKVVNGEVKTEAVKGMQKFADVGYRLGKFDPIFPTIDDWTSRPIPLPKNYGEIYAAELQEVFKGVNHEVEFEFNYDENTFRYAPDGNFGNPNLWWGMPKFAILKIDGVKVIETQIYHMND